MTLERRQWLCSGAFIVDLGHISHLFVVFLSLLWVSKSMGDSDSYDKYFIF